MISTISTISTLLLRQKTPPVEPPPVVKPPVVKTPVESPPVEPPPAVKPPVAQPPVAIANMPPLEKEEIKDLNTFSLLGSIVSSDLNRDGVVTKNETELAKQNIDGKISYLNIIKSFFPSWGQYLDKQINQLKQKSDSLKVVNNNFEGFSKAGQKDKIDFSDMFEIYLAAKSDGNITNFTQKDLDTLNPPTSPPIEPPIIVQPPPMDTPIDGKANFGENFVKDNESKFKTTPTEGQTNIKIGDSYIDMDLIEEYFDKMQLDDGVDNKFSINVIDQLLDNLKSKLTFAADPNKDKAIAMLELIKATDKNGDGVVTKDELKKTIYNSDFNNDGVVTIDEIKSSGIMTTDLRKIY